MQSYTLWVALPKLLSHDVPRRCLAVCKLSAALAGCPCTLARCMIAVLFNSKSTYCSANWLLPSASGGVPQASLCGSHIHLHRRSRCLQSSGDSAAELSHLQSRLKPHREAPHGDAMKESLAAICISAGLFFYRSTSIIIQHQGLSAHYKVASYMRGSAHARQKVTLKNMQNGSAEWASARGCTCDDVDVWMLHKVIFTEKTVVADAETCSTRWARQKCSNAISAWKERKCTCGGCAADAAMLLKVI